jgi:hypothetical protein
VKNGAGEIGIAAREELLTVNRAGCGSSSISVAHFLLHRFNRPIVFHLLGTEAELPNTNMRTRTCTWEVSNPELFHQDGPASPHE